MADKTPEYTTPPDRRWVTMDAENDSATFGGYEAWATCVCGGRMADAPVASGDQLECNTCGRAFRVQFEQIEGATRKHPMCPACHVGMTHGSGYWCPECKVDITSTFVDTYDDVLREYQIGEWVLELTETCGSLGAEWHTHGTREKTLHHCPACCPECPCACETPACECSHTGDDAPNPNYRFTPRAALYRVLRRTVDTPGQFDCNAEQQAATLAQLDEPGPNLPQDLFETDESDEEE